VTILLLDIFLIIPCAIQQEAKFGLETGCCSQRNFTAIYLTVSLQVERAFAEKTCEIALPVS
jgi:hypothetical protein